MDEFVRNTKSKIDEDLVDLLYQDPEFPFLPNTKHDCFSFFGLIKIKKLEEEIKSIMRRLFY